MKKFEDLNGLLIVIFLAMICWGLIGAAETDALREIEKNGQVASVYVPRREIKLEKDIIGVASYYDYVLKSGWSSVGHLVCATRDFKRGTMVKVTNLDNGKWVICRNTDYGPDTKIYPERVVDLSSAAFSFLAPLSSGLIKKVKIEQL